MYGKVYPRNNETIRDAIRRLNTIAKINGLPLGKPLYCKRNHINVTFYEKPSEKKAARQKAIGRAVRLHAANKPQMERRTGDACRKDGRESPMTTHGNRILIHGETEENAFQGVGIEAGSVAFSADRIFDGSVRREDGHCQASQHGRSLRGVLFSVRLAASSEKVLHQTPSRCPSMLNAGG